MNSKVLFFLVCFIIFIGSAKTQIEESRFYSDMYPYVDGNLNRPTERIGHSFEKVVDTEG